MENTRLNIENMVCGRCEMVVESALKALGLNVEEVGLGYAVVSGSDDSLDIRAIEKELKRFNFGLLQTEDDILVEKVKTLLIKLIDSGRLDSEELRLSEYLSSELNKSYATISRLFSSKEELTIEKYFIRLRIEKAKEWVEYDKWNFSEIAYKLGYKNLQHLSRQFKQITGMSMTDYQKLRKSDRKSLDNI